MGRRPCASGRAGEGYDATGSEMAENVGLERAPAGTLPAVALSREVREDAV